MNESNNKKSDLITENLHSRPREFKPNIYNKALLGYLIFYLISATIFLFSRNSVLRSISLLLLLIPFLILWAIPLVWILAKIALRTKSYDFAFQFFVYFQSIPCLIVLTLNFILTEYYFLEYSFLHPFGPLVIPQLIFLFGWVWFKKPIFWKDNLDKFKAPLISRQSIRINEELDGYSQRSISLKYDSLDDLIQSPFDFKTQLENYCIYLGKKGELIDWHIEESFAILYPRFLILTPNLFKNPLFFFQFLRKLYTKRDLTFFHITCSPPQISINIAFQDYSNLNREVTYRTLCLKVLESVKYSLTAFIEEDYEAAYNWLIDDNFRVLESSSDIEE